MKRRVKKSLISLAMFLVITVSSLCADYEAVMAKSATSYLKSYSIYSFVDEVKIIYYDTKITALKNRNGKVYAWRATYTPIDGSKKEKLVTLWSDKATFPSFASNFGATTKEKVAKTYTVTAKGNIAESFILGGLTSAATLAVNPIASVITGASVSAVVTAMQKSPGTYRTLQVRTEFKHREFGSSGDYVYYSFLVGALTQRKDLSGNWTDFAMFAPSEPMYEGQHWKSYL